MQEIYEALVSRRSELTGYLATQEEVVQIGKRLSRPEYAIVLRIYRELPVCGMIVRFIVDANKLAGPPVDEAVYEYDPDCDHEFDWATPKQIIDEIEDSLAGPAAFAAGFVPLGMCTRGGDGYFLRLLSPRKAPVHLFQVYYDWYDADRGVLVMPDAVSLVCDRVDQLLRVAKFEKGLPRTIG